MSTTDTAASEKKVNAKTDSVFHAHCYVAGKKINSDNLHEVKSPYDNRIVGTVAWQMQRMHKRQLKPL